MYRRRGRTLGTFIIGAIVVAAVIYAAFGRLVSGTLPIPHVRAQLDTAVPSPQSRLGSDPVIDPTTK
jgi:hypothetical protein